MKKAVWRTAHASAIGTAHVNQNTECQDRFACQTVETKSGAVLIAVVADGAGSTTDGQIGAEIACKFFIDEVSLFLDSQDASINSLNLEFGRFWIGYFQKKIEEIAAKDKKTLRDFASTFVAAVIGETCAAFFQIGDGGAVFSVSGELKSYQFAIEPEESEYINVTDFLTDETAFERLRFVLIEEKIEDVILFSDGVASVAVDFQTNQPHEPFLMPMIAPLRNGNASNDLNEKLEKFLGSPKINKKTDDDKTIILASRKSSEFQL